MPQQASDLMDLVQQLTDRNNADDLDGIVALYTENAVLVRLPPIPPYAGIAIGRQAIRAWYAQQMPNLHVVSHSIRTYGPIVMWESTISGDAFRRIGIVSFEIWAEASVSDGKFSHLTVTLPPEAVSAFEAARMKRGTNESE